MNKLPIILVTFGVAGSLSAQDARFKNWDKNKDGKLAKTEVPQPLQKNFAKVDTNKDGFISLQEHNAVVQRDQQRRSNDSLKGIKVIKNLDYAGTGNPRHKLDLFLPEARKNDSPLPLLVFIHGGGWRKGSKDGAGRRLAGFVSSGKYAGAAINYRLTDEAQWPAQIHDCKAAIRWLRGNAAKYGMQKDGIAVWGTSAGGHLVAMLGVSGDVEGLEGDLGDFDDESSRVQAVVDYFGPTEFLTMGKGEVIDHRSPTSPEGLLIGGAPAEKKEAAQSASPVTHVSADDAPHLIVHGDGDLLVPVQQSENLDQLLDDVGVESTFLLIKGGGHGQRFDENLLEKKIGIFLDRHLRGGKGKVKEEVLKAKI
ncbi:MAG: alpha/beta hydrolase fold domain-containing protein [Verrucomicrobiota bacterium]